MLISSSEITLHLCIISNPSNSLHHFTAWEYIHLAGTSCSRFCGVTEQVTWLVITEVRSKSFRLVTERHHDILILCVITHIFAYWTSTGFIMHIVLFIVQCGNAHFLWEKLRTQSLSNSLIQLIWCAGNRTVPTVQTLVKSRHNAVLIGSSANLSSSAVMPSGPAVFLFLRRRMALTTLFSVGASADTEASGVAADMALSNCALADGWGCPDNAPPSEQRSLQQWCT